MLPSLSCAIEPIQRNWLSGAKVPCWKTVGPLPLSRSSYQRTPVDEPAATEWLARREPTPLKLRYDKRYIRRSPRESSCWLTPDCGIQEPPLQASENEATGMLVGPVTDTVPAAKFGFMRKRFRELVPKLRKYSAVPAGGAAVVP